MPIRVQTEVARRCHSIVYYQGMLADEVFCIIGAKPPDMRHIDLPPCGHSEKC